jgi:hypothetical protein
MPPAGAAYAFNYSQSPFAFNISRTGAGTDAGPLFSTAGSRLVFKVAAMLPCSSHRLHAEPSQHAESHCTAGDTGTCKHTGVSSSPKPKRMHAAVIALLSALPMCLPK